MGPVSSVQQIDTLLANCFENEKEKIVSLILQYQIDEFIKEVKGDLQALSPVKHAAVAAAALGITFLNLQGVAFQSDVLQYVLQFDAMFPNLRTVQANGSDKPESWPSVKLRLLVREPSEFFVNEVAKIQQISKRVKGLAASYYMHANALKVGRQEQINAFLSDESSSVYDDELIENLMNDVIHHVAQETAMTAQEVEANIEADIVEAWISKREDLQQADFAKEITKFCFGSFTKSEEAQLSKKLTFSLLFDSSCAIL